MADRLICAVHRPRRTPVVPIVLAVVPVLYACRVVAKSEQRKYLASLGQIEALEPCLPEHSARSSNAFSASAEVRGRKVSASVPKRYNLPEPLLQRRDLEFERRDFLLGTAHQ